MVTSSNGNALLAFCAGNSPVTGEFPVQSPVTRSFDVFFDLRLNRQLSKQWRRWWFETLPRLLLRHCNARELIWWPVALTTLTRWSLNKLADILQTKLPKTFQNIYRKSSNIRHNKSKNLNYSHIVLGDDPTAYEGSTSLLPTRLRLILMVWWYHSCDGFSFNSHMLFTLHMLKYHQPFLFGVTIKRDWQSYYMYYRLWAITPGPHFNIKMGK